MTDEEKLRIVKANIARYYPGDRARKVMFSRDEIDHDQCRQCGRCCALFGIGGKKEIQAIADESSHPLNETAKFILEHMIQVTDREFLEAHGVRENWSLMVDSFWSCTLLDENGKCSRYKERPVFCVLFPLSRRTVPAECCFAGTEEYAMKWG